MAKKLTYRGKGAEELRALTPEAFTGLVKSRARRTLRRMGFKFKKLLEQVAAAKKSGKVVETHVREAVIMPDWLGMKFAIHNGKQFKPITIEERMVGRRLGEFAHTTGRVLHSGPGVGATRGSKFIPLK